MVWLEIWQWLIDNYIFHAIVVIAVIFIIFFPGRSAFLFRRIRKIGATGIELSNPDIPPDTPCPYVKARDEAFSMLRNTDSKIETLSSEFKDQANELKKLAAMVNNMSIDQQKQCFFDPDQPDEERLAGGLKYLYYGGNGALKPAVVKLAKEKIHIYKALISVKPKLRIEGVEGL